MALSSDTIREYKSNVEPVLAQLPMTGSDTIYQNAAVSADGSSYAAPLTAGNTFYGFADAKVDNSGGSAGDKNVTVRQRGMVKLDVAAGGTLSGDQSDQGSAVYASDDDTFTGSSTGNTKIGQIVSHISGTDYWVYFEAAPLQM